MAKTELPVDEVKETLEQRFTALFDQYKDLEARYNKQHDKAVEDGQKLLELSSIAEGAQRAMEAKEEEIKGLNQIIEGRLQELENCKAALFNAQQTAERLFNMLEGFSRGLSK